MSEITMTEPTQDTLTQRLEQLERGNRRMKFFGGGALIIFLTFFVMGQTLPASPIVEAQRFLIKDPKTGKARAALSLLQDGSVGLSIIAPDGRSLSLSADAGGNMGLTLYDKNRKLRAELSSGPDGAPVLALRDPAGKVFWKAP